MFHYIIIFLKFIYFLIEYGINALFPEHSFYSPYFEIGSINIHKENNSSNLNKKDIILPKYQIYKKEIEEPFYYTYLNKGKEIRKYLFQYAQFLVGNNSNACYIPEDIEKLHNCSLIIDDIQDKSKIRRGEMCAYKKYGMSLSLSSSYLVVFEVLNHILKTYSNPLEHVSIIQDEMYNLHYGQSLDIYWKKHNLIPSIEDFLQMIDGKTGSVFRVLIRMCGIENNCSVLEEASQLFIQLARFFQIRDDYINITLPDYWKKKGFCEDFDERKISYLLVLNKTITKENLQDFFIFPEETKLIDTQKITLYSKLYNQKVLHKTYQTLEDMRKNIFMLEQKIRNSRKPSHYLKSFFEKLPYCPPMLVENLIKYLE